MGFQLRQVPLAGGDSVPLENPFRRPYLQGILPGRGELVVEDDVRPVTSDPLWLLPTTGGNARPLGDIEASNSMPSADGQRIVYINEQGVFVARNDGTGSRRLLSTPALFPRLSPDGRRLRYGVPGGTGETCSTWEAAIGGGDAHPLQPFLPGWSVCSGRWTPDGRYYVFVASREGETALWARRERGSWPWSGWRPSEPSPLTSGPMSYSQPSLSPDGRTIVAAGQPPTTGGELVRYDPAAAAFKPLLEGLSAWDLEFSRDGRWIAYVQYPEGTLWRSHPDGTERRQLSFPPATVLLPRWSPDGQRIAYSSLSPGGTWNSFIVAAEGGKPRPVTDQANVMDASWSPDGAKLAVFESGALTGAKPLRIQVVDLQTGKVSILPGSEGLFSPRWSPDGRSIAAFSGDATRLALYQFASRRWRDLITGGGEFLSYPTWLRDSSRIQLLKSGAIVRVRRADGHLETVVSPDVARMAQFVFRSPTSPGWLGAAPDGSPLLLRKKSSIEIYALEVEWP